MKCPPELASDMQQRAVKIEVILMDVDGVLTAGDIVYNSNGEEIKFFNAHDGLGIRLAHEAGLKTGLISARDSEAIRIRARELKMELLYLGKYNKLKSYDMLMKEADLRDEQVCFIGDDLPDLPVLQRVGFPVAVKNASAKVKETIPFHSERAGGEGAIREIIEYILQAKGKLDQLMELILKLD